MGAANCPETPRQKMIGMMYLVLTALLALNVSKDIIDAFVIVNDGMITTNDNFNKKLETSYSAFEQQYTINQGKVGPHWDKAKQVRDLSKEMVAFIEQMKYEVISITDGIPIEEAKTVSLHDVKKKDNFDKPTFYFIGEKNDASSGNARKLKDKINEYKTTILNFVDEKHREGISKKIGLNTEDVINPIQGKLNWEKHNFYHTILAADIVILNKLIAEVKNAEYDVVTQLYSGITLEDFKFNQIAAKVVPNANYVLIGDEFKAQIFVAAFDTSQNPEIVVGDAADSSTFSISGSPKEITVSNGVGYLSIPASSEGLQKYGGIIKVTNPSGGETKYAFNGEYNVGRPAATVSAEKMNVFYIGLDNPVSVSVPGIPAEKVSVSMSGGSMSPAGRGRYNVRVTGGSKATINVAAEYGGQRRSMGTFEYRIKKVPDPIPVVAGKKGGVISRGQITAAPYVVATLEDFLFDGVKYDVTSYTFSTLEGSYIKEVAISGARLNASALSLVNKAKSGQKLFFENIRARGPGGDSRSLPSVILKLQ
jgi:gliding motility-associated protein GldM